MMRTKIEQLLPLIRNGEIAGDEVAALIGEIRGAIRQDPSQGRELGGLISIISNAQKQQTEKPVVEWVSFGAGGLAIGHKPGGKIPFDKLKQAGATAVLTLLHENEGALSIGKGVQQAQMGWIWFPFSASKPHAGEQLAEVNALFDKLIKLLCEGAKIYIHCSAGIHRTGMITYGLLRSMGHTEKAAAELLQQLRAVTAAQAGAERLVWGDQFGEHN